MAWYIGTGAPPDERRAYDRSAIFVARSAPSFEVLNDTARSSRAARAPGPAKAWMIGVIAEKPGAGAAERR